MNFELEHNFRRRSAPDTEPTIGSIVTQVSSSAKADMDILTSIFPGRCDARYRNTVHRLAVNECTRMCALLFEHLT